MPDALDEIAFTDAYARAFASGDPTTVAGFYAAPCVSVRGDGGYVGFETGQAVEAFFDKVIALYRGEGMTAFRASGQTVETIGQSCARIDCRWDMLAAGDRVIRSWHQTYILRHDQRAWRIITSIFH